MRESKNLANWLSPERRAEHARIREQVKAELPEIREHARKRHEHHEENMQYGTPPAPCRQRVADRAQPPGSERRRNDG